MAISVLTIDELIKFNKLYPDILLDELPEDELLIGYIEESPLRAAGILMAHPEGRTMLLDWIFVDENSRQRGGGRAMLELLRDSCEASGEIDAVIITFYDKNLHMDNLLTTCGFISGYMPGCKSFVTRLSRIKSPKGIKAGKVDYLHLDQVSEEIIEKLNRYLSMNVISNIGIELPLRPEDYRKESMVHISNGIIDSLWLVSDEEDGVSFPWFFNRAQDPIVPIELMNQVLRELKMNFPKETKVFVTSIKPNVENVIYNYFNPQAYKEIYFGVYLAEDAFLYYI